MVPEKKYHKKAILQVLPELITGGVERGTVDLSKELVAHGFKSIVVSSGGPLVSIIEKHGGKHYTIPAKSKNPFVILKNIKRIKSIIKKENVSIVHARSRAPAWSAYFAAKDMRKPFVTTFHGFYKFSTIFKKWYNSVMTKGCIVIAVSEFIKDHILEHYSVPVDNIEVIHRGVDTESFDPAKISYQRMSQTIEQYKIPDNKTIIFFPGRMSSWKGQDLLIRASQFLPKDQFHYIFAGNLTKKPKYYEKLNDLCHKFGITDHTTFTNDVQDISAMYKLSDIVISASVEPEAFGRIAIEAQSMSKIVIASDIGGSKETIINSKTGFLFKSEDIEDLAKKILLTSKLTHLQKVQIGKAARSHIIKEFSLKKMRDKTIDLYNRIIESNLQN